MKIALVTGGSRGLGKSMSLQIAAKGSDVVLTYNTKKADAEEVVKQIEKTGRKAAALALDVFDKTFKGRAVGSVGTSISWSTMPASASTPPLGKPAKSNSMS